MFYFFCDNKSLYLFLAQSVGSRGLINYEKLCVLTLNVAIFESFNLRFDEEGHANQRRLKYHLRTTRISFAEVKVKISAVKAIIFQQQKCRGNEG